MSQWLKRGLEIEPSIKIRKMLSDGDNWQIYISSDNRYVLAVDDVLYRKWQDQNKSQFNANSILEKFKLIEEDARTVYVFLSEQDFLISSTKKGPYPLEWKQVIAFASLYADAEEQKINIEDAIFIEQKPAILPVSDAPCNYQLAFGKWLSAGVNVSLEQTDELGNLVSWVPNEVLEKMIDSIGVQRSKNRKTKKRSSTIDSTKAVPDEPFVLTGRKELETFINDNIVDIIRKPEEYKKMGIDFPGATILYGPPGSGKTFAVEKLAEYLGWDRFDINADSVASPYIHETSKMIAQVFNEAIEAAPSVLIIDEMEAYLSTRETSNQKHKVEETAEFLRKIPEAISQGVLIFAMTNMIDSIDPAITRRGRFDYLIEIQMPNFEEVKSLLDAKLEALPVADDVIIEDIARKLAGHPLSDVTFVLREAGKRAVKLDLERINMECMNFALEHMPKIAKANRQLGFNPNRS